MNASCTNSRLLVQESEQIAGKNRMCLLTRPNSKQINTKTGDN